MSQDTSVSVSVRNDHQDSGRIGNNTQVGNNTGYGSVGLNPLICSEGIEPITRLRAALGVRLCVFIFHCKYTFGGVFFDKSNGKTQSSQCTVPRGIKSSNLHHEKLEIMEFLHSNPLSMDIKLCFDILQ